MTQVQALNPLTMPLRGRQVIEASAGTGKTWTLAALYVRLVLGHVPDRSALGPALFPPQILVMTFTDAATAELRGRIRERLAQAAAHFRQDSRAEPDDFLRELGEQIDPAAWPEAAWRLDMAAQWMDDAAIFTIHGWSHRMLRQHAFDSASLFEQARVEDAQRLQLMAVQDYWREWFYPLDRELLPAVQGLAATPQQLLTRLREKWAPLERSPLEQLGVGDDPHTVLHGWAQWQSRLCELEETARAVWREHADKLKPVLLQAMANDLNGNTYRKDSHEAYLQQLDAWAQGEPRDAAILKRFALSTLQEKTKKGCTTPADTHGIFECIQQMHDALEQQPDVTEPLLTHAAHTVAKAYDLRKQELAQFDFSDLLQRLYHAVQAEDGRLAAAIQQQYPVALVDEFQDTDPWQYGALSRIYTGADDQLGLIMIGDPKQAIYGFRGADLNTYLQARQEAQAIHTLSGNFRSTPGVVQAVNHVFQHAHQPFGEVPYDEVQARNPKVLPWQVGGTPQAAMTVWHLPSGGSISKHAYQQAMAQVFASQMVGLLAQGAAQPGDMAVLVRDWAEAAAIRQALAARGVRSVYLSERDSVFNSAQARDVWRILRAVAAPRQTAWVKAALLTRLWGMPWQELEALVRDEAAWDAMVDRFHGWLALWQRQGFLPMLYRLLHDAAIPARLLAADAQTGERALTNLLHLGDLLQAASLHLQGEGALIRYLEDQLRDPQAGGDAAQLRLESDADLVQVITMHKSKGLQYPLVFLPFAASFRSKGDAAQLDEDVRLLYVALTRAERALWVGVAQLSGDFDTQKPAIKSALSRLVGRQTPGDLPHRLNAWAGCEQIKVQPAPEPDDRLWMQQEQAEPTLKPAATPLRMHKRQGWMASFSALTRQLGAAAPQTLASEREERWGDAQIDSVPLDDWPAPEPAQPPVPARYDAFPAGSTYGTLLHDLLEWQAHRRWPAWADSGQPAAWPQEVERQARALRLEPEHQTLLLDWVPAVVRAELPLPDAPPLALCSLPPERMWPEMGFTLPVHRLSAAVLDQHITRHIHPGQVRPTLQAVQLEGQLTGFMDLVLEHAGRYYVLDHKSNRLPAYDAAALQQAMLAHRYDVQLTLYVLALHRLLQARLPGYDYDRHMGGGLYLFLRGIDQPGAGLYSHRPERALIETLDAALKQQETADA